MFKKVIPYYIIIKDRYFLYQIHSDIHDLDENWHI